MSQFIKKNKVLFWVVAIVLAGGACLAAVLISQAQTAMAAEQIVTAAEDASETPAAAETPAEPTPEATAEPQPTVINTTLSADALSIVVERKERRRSHIIPSLDGSDIHDADTWKAVEPEGLSPKALSSAAAFAKAFFGYDMAEDNVNLQCYIDASGHRGDIIRVSTRDEAIVCTLAAETLELIEIDYYFIPAAPQEEDYDFKTVPESDRQIADNIAAVFNTTVSDIYHTSGGGGKGIWRSNYALKMANGKLAQFAVMNGSLYAIAIYPSEACMQEGVYFDADVQMSESLVESASPQDFKKGEPGADDMTEDEAENIYEQFLTLANGEGKYDKPKTTFYIDNSGQRENYWHLEGKQLAMDISSKSKWIVSLTCNDLWNSGHDLTKIDYDAMGGDEYADYVANIMGGIYGSGFKNASNDAVYDYHYCTEDAWMADGSVYEFMFADGKLRQVFYYADEDCFRAALSGWKADNEYVNSVTGETFIPS